MAEDGAEVLVIGAGAAGLAAARDLAASGLRVRVLEARGRVGGRVHTLREPALPVPVELGAEYIHGEPRETWAIVERANLLACETPGLYWRSRGGVLEDSGEFWAELGRVFGRLKREGGRDRTFAEFLAEAREGEHAREAARLYVEGFHAARSERIGTRGLLKAEEASGRVNGDRQFRVLDGYGRVVERLRDEFEQGGGEVFLDTAVEEVRWRPGGVEVSARGAGGERVTHTASRVVITLPLGLLQRQDGEGSVRFVPDLPDKRDAAKRLEVGHVARVVLRFREPFWEKLELPSVDGKRSLSKMSFLSSPESWGGREARRRRGSPAAETTP
jgi:monoamine oxidase